MGSNKNKEKQEYAFMLFMKGTPSKEIAVKVGVSANTVTRWTKDLGWDIKRQSSAISNETLVNKARMKVLDILDSDTPNADALAKAVKGLKSLQKDETIDDYVNVFASFGDWLISRSGSDKSIDTAFVKKVTEAQDKFIMEKING
ncbi:MAG: hypothetical protein ACRC6R_10150 [Bacteroidales bacterium]